ncbi:hypothetical protein C7M84_002310 [Penaeus vannamei]|uniref:Uncharacterized protein n=1 Tax=Penaeus vannamei TaxID=6689 RepID=A0A3R7SWR6_PENVA|nr:hypothetical protein C7M84_002310 [Penaeus vannamei]
MRSSMIVGLVASITAMLAVIIITMVVVMSPNTGGLKSYEDFVINGVKTDSIREFLRNLTVSPHQAGSARDLDIAKWIKDQWIEHGLSNVKLIPYEVFLSHPDADNPNMFHILDHEGNVTHSSNPHQPPVEATPPVGQESILSFNAFSANGTVQVSRVVYANYGSLDDFDLLEEMGVDVGGAIVVIRYGKLYGSREDRRAVGVILYTDPKERAQPYLGPKPVPATPFTHPPRGPRSWGPFAFSRGTFLLPVSSHSFVCPPFPLPLFLTDLLLIFFFVSFPLLLFPSLSSLMFLLSSLFLLSFLPLSLSFIPLPLLPLFFPPRILLLDLLLSPILLSSLSPYSTIAFPSPFPFLHFPTPTHLSLYPLSQPPPLAPFPLVPVILSTPSPPRPCIPSSTPPVPPSCIPSLPPPTPSPVSSLYPPSLLPSSLTPPLSTPSPSLYPLSSPPSPSSPPTPLLSLSISTISHPHLPTFPFPFPSPPPPFSLPPSPPPPEDWKLYGPRRRNQTSRLIHGLISTFKEAENLITANQSAHRIPEEQTDSPGIPVQPVGYEDAQQILSILEGDSAPDEWQGGLDMDYKLGGDLAGHEVRLEVHNVNSREQVYNVVGALIGQEEPDRYGTDREPLRCLDLRRGIDPSSATATLLELARLFGEMTLVFCSWAAEEPGVIGSTEFAEQFSAILKDRAVVYLNVDMVMEGNYSFMASAVPTLYDVIVDTSKLVPNPDRDEVEAGRGTLYDTWVHPLPQERSLVVEGPTSQPLFHSLGTGSDFRAYVFNLGIPCLDLCFASAPDDPGLPLYHSAYETNDLALLMDRDLLYHQATARMWGLLALEFSTRPVLPFSLKQFSDFAKEEFKIFKNKFGAKLLLLGVSTANLDAAIKSLGKNIDDFLERLDAADWNNDLVLRTYNDAMMLMERAFLSPFGLPDRPLLNHVLLAPSTLNGYVWDVFPGLRDLLRTTNVSATDVKEHMAAVTHHFNMSASALSFRFW